MCVFKIRNETKFKTMKELGIITGTFGTKGEIMLASSSGKIFLPKNTEIFIGFSENFCEKYILDEDYFEGTQKKQERIKLKNINSKEEAQALKEKAVFVPREVIVKHNSDIIFEDEIIGSEVLDIETNEKIGEIVEVWIMPANDVWLVKTDEGKMPIPVIDDVVKSVDLENKIVKIYLLEGLKDIITKEGN